VQAPEELAYERICFSGRLPPCDQVSHQHGLTQEVGDRIVVYAAFGRQAGLSQPAQQVGVEPNGALGPARREDPSYPFGPVGQGNPVWYRR
jgi:hypothetical protein